MFRKDCFGKADIKQAFFDQFGFFLEATPGWWSRADRFWPCCRAAQTNKCENRAQAGLLGWMPSLGWRPSLLGTTTLLGAPGLTRSKKLLGTKGIATRSKAEYQPWPFFACRRDRGLIWSNVRPSPCFTKAGVKHVWIKETSGAK